MNLDEFGACKNRLDRDRAASDIADRLHGIAHEIEQRLLDLQHVDHHERQVGRDGRIDAHGQAFKIGAAQIDCFPDNVIDPASDAVAAVEADQRPQTPHHRGGALDLRDRLRGGFRHGAGVCAAGPNGVIDQARIGAGRHQRLV